MVPTDTWSSEEDDQEHSVDFQQNDATLIPNNGEDNSNKEDRLVLYSIITLYSVLR